MLFSRWPYRVVANQVCSHWEGCDEGCGAACTQQHSRPKNRPVRIFVHKPIPHAGPSDQQASKKVSCLNTSTLFNLWLNGFPRFCESKTALRTKVLITYFPKVKNQIQMVFQTYHHTIFRCHSLEARGWPRIRTHAYLFTRNPIQWPHEEWRHKSTQINDQRNDSNVFL